MYVQHAVVEAVLRVVIYPRAQEALPGKTTKKPHLPKTWVPGYPWCVFADSKLKATAAAETCRTTMGKGCCAKERSFSMRPVPVPVPFSDQRVILRVGGFLLHAMMAVSLFPDNHMYVARERGVSNFCRLNFTRFHSKFSET